MCGISGFISSSSMYEQNLDKTLRLMSTRGPDNKNLTYYQTSNKKKTSGKDNTYEWLKLDCILLI